MLSLFILGSGAFAGYSLLYAMKGLKGDKVQEKKIGLNDIIKVIDNASKNCMRNNKSNIDDENDSKDVIDVEYEEL
jgi:hypothetical protein